MIIVRLLEDLLVFGGVLVRGGAGGRGRWRQVGIPSGDVGGGGIGRRNKRSY